MRRVDASPLVADESKLVPYRRLHSSLVGDREHWEKTGSTPPWVTPAVISTWI